MKLQATTAIFVFFLMAAGALSAQNDLGVAVYTDQLELEYPDNTDEWVHLGTTLGGDYSETAFDAANPGVLGVVQMEPTAYRFFKEHGEYADGSMFLLSFYESVSKSSPQLRGLVQGAMRAQEIHVIDKQRYAEGSAFFLYDSPQQSSSTRIAEGSDCMRCHTEEGDYQATFIQFYPTIRDMPRK